MPNLKSAKKRLRQNVKLRANNRARRSTLRTHLKRANAAISSTTGDGATTQQELLAAFSRIDKACKEGLIHRNTAARRKSQLQRRFNASQAS